MLRLPTVLLAHTCGFLSQCDHATVAVLCRKWLRITEVPTASPQHILISRPPGQLSSFDRKRPKRLSLVFVVPRRSKRHSMTYSSLAEAMGYAFVPTSSLTSLVVVIGNWAATSLAPVVDLPHLTSLTYRGGGQGQRMRHPLMITSPTLLQVTLGLVTWDCLFGLPTQLTHLSIGGIEGTFAVEEDGKDTDRFVDQIIASMPDLTHLKFPRALNWSHVLALTSSLVHLEFASVRLDSDEPEEVMETKKLCTLQSLCVNSIEDSKTSCTLARFVQSSPSITELCVQPPRITMTDLLPLWSATLRSTKLKRLSLDIYDGSFLAVYLPATTTTTTDSSSKKDEDIHLESLHVITRFLDIFSMDTAICDLRPMSRFSTLRSLDLGSIEPLGNVFPTLLSLTSLSMCGSRMTTSRLASIATSFLNIATLSCLEDCTFGWDELDPTVTQLTYLTHVTMEVFMDDYDVHVVDRILESITALKRCAPALKTLWVTQMPRALGDALNHMGLVLKRPTLPSPSFSSFL